jgi:hypothetical protein
MADQLRFIGKLVHTLGRFENVVWNTWQEIAYWAEMVMGNSVCFCPNTLAFFRRWLAERYGDLDALNRAWLEARDWGARVAWTGNEIMNVGVLLQYARDFQSDARAGKAVAVLLEWLAAHHINPATGVWGDVDMSDPLCRTMQLKDCRRADIAAALTKAAGWVLTNQMPDGGFVFVRNLPFEYGHPALRCEAGQGAMFPTWFRLLSLALIGKALPGHALARVPWRFVRCPGMPFLGECG